MTSKLPLLARIENKYVTITQLPRIFDKQNQHYTEFNIAMSLTDNSRFETHTYHSLKSFLKIFDASVELTIWLIGIEFCSFKPIIADLVAAVAIA